MKQERVPFRDWVEIELKAEKGDVTGVPFFVVLLTKKICAKNLLDLLAAHAKYKKNR